MFLPPHIAVIMSSTGIEIGLIIGVSAMFSSIAIHIINSLVREGYRIGKLETRQDSADRQIEELKESHRSVWSYLINHDDFRNSLNGKRK